MTRAAILTIVAVLALTLVGVVGIVSRAQEPALGAEWRTFEGSWTLTGRRQTLPTEDGGSAAVIQLSGAITLKNAPGLSGGLLGEMIGFDDGQRISTGRAVWTDSHGDRVFSALRGERIETGRRVTAIITGGTGRYAGITGVYELTWQYVVRGEDEMVHGRAVDLRGRFRAGEAPR